MSFTAPSERVSFHGLLFDMDGTIVDSTRAIVKFWHTIGAEIGVDPKVILQTSHGRRTIDMLKVLAPEKATPEYVSEIEAQVPKLYGKDAVEIPGARALVTSVISANAPWAIVTSGSIPFVTGWLDILNIPAPEHLVTAESVEKGKPDPAGYSLGRDKLKFGPDAQLLVLEDSPAGIRAGKAAGCKVIGLVTTHTLEQVLAAEPDWVLEDLRFVEVVEYVEDVVTLQISNAWAQALG
ncbi:hypothetical protein B7494_g2631 [Chlorociboria aeruginascens]|nr:hypothetical protein B7494_g2631 [Chlorociboria aeruginascens]